MCVCVILLTAKARQKAGLLNRKVERFTGRTQLKTSTISCVTVSAVVLGTPDRADPVGLGAERTELEVDEIKCEKNSHPEKRAR